jgi:hypothetical protein
MPETGEKATPFTTGSKLYHERARRALPLLVRQAESGEAIAYSDLADELDMPNARNLNFVLGSIGETLQQLSKTWQQNIPPIQCLVVNKETGLPGEGFAWFLVDRAGYAKLSLSQKQAVVKAELARIFAYPGWRKVLASLQLKPVSQAYAELLAQAAAFRSAGESDAHKRLKKYVATHPNVVGLAATHPRGAIEFGLPSGDSLDVSFRTEREWVAAEVKSELSQVPDVVRGIYQCVKYRAVMEATLAAAGDVAGVRAVLVLQSGLSPNLIPLRNTLGIEVIDNVWPSADA